ncbi:hypothetical protein CLI64_29195 [Nostoc sp. CENA543]|uniref:hypothetical protein n=1 Tax=Nostoc sp. CENA543 TaxID=1869241 RepID=UPI000CA0EBAC|nr:hypothetical protein [Nostoc sp. CENA543]AUT04133.1 hypothetical protein CLI64_29195 [Nostoc sp. CENA543]
MNLYKNITTLKDTLYTSTEKLSWKQIAFPLILSIGFSLFYSFLALQKGLRTAYVAQDDAREYVFWMQKFIDPELFQQDLIGDYFQSITPWGYASLYKIMAYFGVEPLLLSKIIPTFLGLIITIYCFYLCIKIFPVPGAAFLVTLILNQSLWFKSDLVSATPKSFFTPIFLAFIYYLITDSWLNLCLLIILAGLFYPPLIFICLGILLIRLRHHYLWVMTITGLALLVMLPYILSSAQFGPVVTATQAFAMPELWPGGRHPFFHPNPLRFWLIGQHSGILPPLMPPLIWLGLFFPLLKRKFHKFPLMNLVNPQVKILTQIIIVSLTLFFTAHTVILKLFFPTRYTIHTFRIVMAIAAGMTLAVILDWLLRQYRQKHQFWQLGLAITLISVLLLYPHLSGRFPTTDYRASTASALYEYLQQQPKDSLIATLSDEADNIPTFARRPILVGREYALPFHLSYYTQIRQRARDLIQAQYSPDLTSAKQLIQKYGIDFWLVETTSFQVEYLTSKTWLKSFQPAFTASVNNLSSEKTPALATVTKACAVLETANFLLLKSECIINW